MDKYVDFGNIPDHIRRIKLDIGLSYCAPHSYRWLSRETDLFVFGFEPNPECIEALNGRNRPQCFDVSQKLISGEMLDRFCLCPIALGNVFSVSEMDFYMMADDCGTSSLLRPVDPKLGEVKQVTKVPVLSLSMFFDIFPWDRFPYIEYIKVDAQGADLDIIKGAGKYLSERIVFVTLEPESAQYENCQNNTESNMTEYMTSQGFERIHHPNTNDPTFVNSKYKFLAESIYIHQI